MQIEAFIQARMSSTRLPGKVLKKVLDKPLLEFQIERLRDSNELDAIVVLTTTHSVDDVIASFCEERNILCFRGSEDDVLDRYFQAAVIRKPDGIVRITSDCPLIDPEIIDQLVSTFRASYPNVDYISNTLERTFPRGLDAEVFSFKALKQAFFSAQHCEEREHVTVYFYRNPEKFNIKNISHLPKLDYHRWTVDTSEDFELIRRILENLYPSHPSFRLRDILNLLSQYPEWINLNAHVEQKKLADLIEY